MPHEVDEGHDHANPYNLCGRVVQLPAERRLIAIALRIDRLLDTSRDVDMYQLK